MSLTSSWLPATMQLVALAVLLTAIGWRSRRWRLVWLPGALLVGLVLAAAVYWFVGYQGWGQNPAPSSTWLWVALAGMAAVVLVAAP